MESYIAPVIFLLLLILGIFCVVNPLGIAILILRIPEFFFYLTKEKYLTSRNIELFSMKNSEPNKIPANYPLLMIFVRLSGIFAILMFLISACIFFISVQ
jgi:hypothetical protein